MVQVNGDGSTLRGLSMDDPSATNSMLFHLYWDLGFVEPQGPALNVEIGRQDFFLIFFLVNVFLHNKEP